jgi:hypothetical protein
MTMLARTRKRVPWTSLYLSGGPTQPRHRRRTNREVTLVMVQLRLHEVTPSGERHLAARADDVVENPDADEVAGAAEPAGDKLSSPEGWFWAMTMAEALWRMRLGRPCDVHFREAK